jgi:prepilin-type N-terminal cleavage/methylation domain-containing protein
MIKRYRNHRATPSANRAFTLIELLVTMVIISIVTGLSLSGLAASRQRAKIDKTKSTIQKLHEIVMPQYESYLSRRVAATNPTARLAAIRLLMVQEMPDQWADVYAVASLPTHATAPTRRYAQLKATFETGPNWASNGYAYYESAECLALIVLRGGFNPEAVETFRTDEIGDVDSDNAPEFLDGWGKPIRFVRWPTGFMSSPASDSFIQPRDAAINPDPFDPQRVSRPVRYPSNAQNDFGVTPLIYSAGPDGGQQNDLATSGAPYGVQGSAGALPSGWLSTAAVDFYTNRVSHPVPGSSDPLATPLTPLAGSVTDWSAASDNITNHDLLSQ